MRGARLSGRIGLEGVSGVGNGVRHSLPAGLQDGSRLPEPMFTPATKSQDGAHDENISFAAVEKLVGADEAAELRRLTLAIYRRAASACGIVRADPGRHKI